jgi:hypothetical protein
LFHCFLVKLASRFVFFSFSGFFLKSNAKFCPSPHVRFLTLSYQPALVVNILPTPVSQQYLTKRSQNQMIHLNRRETVVQDFLGDEAAGGPRREQQGQWERRFQEFFRRIWVDKSSDVENVNVQSARPR